MHFICRFKQLVLLFIFSGIMLSAQAAPIGGHVTAGTGTISQSGNTTTIHQQSQNLSLNWNKFDIAPKEMVNFAQPNSHALAVNRVLGSHQASQIQGHLNANGQVWLINPNGVVFGKNAIVNVGGLLASTLEIADSELTKSQRRFSGSGTGGIINKGHIQTIKGGYVAMIANTVSNQGHIHTPQGTTALAGGSQVTVSFAENQLTGIRVDKSTLHNLVENKQVIQAPGGTVIMTAGAHDSLLSSAVNNSGIVEAQTLSNHKGNIILLGGLDAGTTTVSGTLDASAPNGGKGGNIETSAAHVKIAPHAKITTQSSQDTVGTWTIDPQDYTIAASGGDITGSQISNLLADNNIIISSDQGQTAGTGNLNVGDAISWSNANSLTLNAIRNINFNNGGTVSNTSGGTLNVRADSGATGTGTIVMSGGSINVSGTGGVINFYYNPATFGTPSTFSNVIAGAGTTFTGYMLVNTPTQLSAIASNSTQNYALGTNLDLSSIANFTPINFSGKLDGLNNTISNLTITGNNANVGLFSVLNAGGVIVKNMILSNVNVSGLTTVGALAGISFGTISNITVSGTVSATASIVGGVIGLAEVGSTGNCITSSVNVSATGINTASNFVGGFAGNITGGTYTNIAVTGSVTTGQHNRYVGGFAGYNNGTIKNAQYTGTMTTPYDGYTGGFVGYTDATSVIQGAYTTADINAGDAGYDSNAGFIGFNVGTIDSSYSTGNVTLGQSLNSGAFVGLNTNNISNSYSTGSITVTPGPVPGGNGAQAPIQNYGGLVGLNSAGALTNDYATGNVNAMGNNPNSSQNVGGLVGFLAAGSISHSYSTGNVIVMGASTQIGGLVGLGAGTMTNVYASGNVSATAASGGAAPTNVGGLIGKMASTLTNGYSVGQVSTSAGATSVGGLIGALNGTISGGSFWDTTTSGQTSSAGGANVVGMNTANMQTQANFTSATTANGNINPNWDFNNTWAMGTGSYLYPIFNPPNAPVVTPGANCPTPAVSYYSLTLSNVSVSNKVYDGTTTAMIMGTLEGVLPGDSVSISSSNGAFDNKNVGNNKPVTISQPTLSGANAGKYLLLPISSTSTTADITPLGITVTATGVNKIYDGTTMATVMMSSTDILAGDNVSFTNTAANFVDKNVGNNKSVSVTGISASGSDAGNYAISSVNATTTANITPLAITVMATGVNKIYDGTTATTVMMSSNGILAGDTVSFTDTTANFVDKNVGSNKLVNITGINTDSSGDGGNYTVINPNATTTADITPLVITVMATGVNKIYDGTTAATVMMSSNGILAGDNVSFTNMAANFNNKNVGSNIPVSVIGISANGSDAGNYTISSANVTTTANITPLGITVTAAGINKIYDATTNATVTLSSTGAIAGDNINFSNTAANFNNKNVGNNKLVSVTGITASGTDVGNYTINSSTANTTADITPLAITVMATGNDKVYDGTTADTVTLSSTGILAGDTVNFTNTAANFNNKNVGSNKPVSVTGISTGGSDGGNYIVNPSASTTANITPLGITVTAAGINKIYDATTNATVTLSSTGVIASDNISFTNTAANFNNKNVGSNKAVSVTGISASGTDATNYIVTNLNANTTADITPLGITVTATGINKIYDATTNATVTLSSTGAIAGDNINFSNTAANFNNKNVGSNKAVSVTGISASGSDATNYIVNSSANTTADITPRAIFVIATGTNKVYDGTVADALILTSNGVIAGDDVTFSSASANFVDKNVGNNIPVIGTDISAGGPDGGNYVVVNTRADSTADITPRAITVTATGQNKVFDGTTNATVTLNGEDIVSGDSVSLNYGSAEFATAGPALNIPITITNITASGADAPNYTLANTRAVTTANIFPIDYIPPSPVSNILLELHKDNVHVLQSITAALQQRLIGDNEPITELNLYIVRGGVHLPNYNSLLGAV